MKSDFEKLIHINWSCTDADGDDVSEHSTPYLAILCAEWKYVNDAERWQNGSSAFMQHIANVKAVSGEPEYLRCLRPVLSSH